MQWSKNPPPSSGCSVPVAYFDDRCTPVSMLELRLEVIAACDGNERHQDSLTASVVIPLGISLIFVRNTLLRIAVCSRSSFSFTFTSETDSRLFWTSCRPFNQLRLHFKSSSCDCETNFWRKKIVSISKRLVVLYIYNSC